MDYLDVRDCLDMIKLIQHLAWLCYLAEICLRFTHSVSFFLLRKKCYVSLNTILGLQRLLIEIITNKRFYDE